jgi:hypothetical protein
VPSSRGFLEELAALTLRPRVNLILNHGGLAPPGSDVAERYLQPAGPGLRPKIMHQGLGAVDLHSLQDTSCQTAVWIRIV